ncbi:hypothetical protein IJG90_03200 [Candidatus Saccharibacteria bacterium]|nr:hypothetical protein [Candidatus Saccharibacteria bacterium]
MDLLWTTISFDENAKKRAKELLRDDSGEYNDDLSPGTRVFVAEKALPEEVGALVRDFATEYQTRVTTPLLRKRAFRHLPCQSELVSGDVIYFRRHGIFAHETGWDRVVILGPNWAPHL